MENYTKEDYLKNRKKKRYSQSIFTFSGDTNCTISQLKECLEKIEKDLSDKEDVNIWIDPARFDVEDYESYLMIGWTDWETENDFQMRMLQNKWAKERAVESLKRLIESNKEEAVEIIKNLGFI